MSIESNRLPYTQGSFIETVAETVISFHRGKLPVLYIATFYKKHSLELWPFFSGNSNNKWHFVSLPCGVTDINGSVQMVA